MLISVFLFVVSAEKKRNFFVIRSDGKSHPGLNQHHSRAQKMVANAVAVSIPLYLSPYKYLLT